MRRGFELGGRYRLERLLGKGGMGQVWEGHDLRLRRAVAVKLLPLRADADSTAVERFRREAEIAAGLQHPGITVVFDIDEHDELLFLVMELLPGEDLGAMVARHPRGLPVDRVISLGVQLCAALAAAHDEGIVHRDIKPANVMVLPGDRVKLCDFGIARVVGHAAGRAGVRTIGSAALTGTGMVGTPLYMAPEQYQGRAVDRRTDLYSLGCLLYQLLTGGPPFLPSNDAAELMWAHLRAKPPGVRAVRSDVPVELDRLIGNLLAKRPDKRPVDARTVIEQLNLVDARAAGAGRSSAAPAPAATDEPILSISQAVLDAIIAHAKADHPIIACGIVAGPIGSDRPERIIPIKNRERSGTFWSFDPYEQYKAYREMDERGEQPVVIYRSYPTRDAWPSRLEFRLAFEDTAHHLIISTRDPKRVDFSSYRIKKGQVTEEEIRFVDSYE